MIHKCKQICKNGDRCSRYARVGSLCTQHHNMNQPSVLKEEALAMQEMIRECNQKIASLEKRNEDLKDRLGKAERKLELIYIVDTIKEKLYLLEPDMPYKKILIG